MAEAPLELAERALSYADGDAQVTVVHERSLSSRFARSAPTQATGVDDTTVEILCLRDGHTASATTNRLDEDSLRAAARKADAVARAAARAGHGDHPGLPAAVDAAPVAGWDAGPPIWIRHGARTRCERRSAGQATPGWRRSGCGPRAPCARRSRRARGSARPTT